VISRRKRWDAGRVSEEDVFGVCSKGRKEGGKEEERRGLRSTDYRKKRTKSVAFRKGKTVSAKERGFAWCSVERVPRLSSAKEERGSFESTREVFGAWESPSLNRD